MNIYKNKIDYYIGYKNNIYVVKFGNDEKDVVKKKEYESDEVKYNFLYFDESNKDDYQKKSFKYDDKVTIDGNYAVIGGEEYLLDNKNHLVEIGDLNKIFIKYTEETKTEITNENYYIFLNRDYSILYPIIKKSYEKNIEYKLPVAIDDKNTIAIAVMLDNNNVIGFISIGIENYTNPVYNFIGISLVSIHPIYQGRKLCIPFLSFVLNNLKERKKSIHIWINSQTPIAACKCYYKAAHDSGYIIYENPKLTELYDIKNCESQVSVDKFQNMFLKLDDSFTTSEE